MTETTDADELYQACKKGDIDTVKKFFNDKSHEIDVGARYEDNRSTLLHAAAGSCNVELLEFLLKNGFTSLVNENDVNEYTALHIAVIKGDPEVCKILLDAKADVSLANQKGDTAFHEACKQNNTEICNLMLDAARTKGLLGVANRNGETPLLIAVRHDKVDVFRLLLEEEVDCFVTDGEGNNVLHVASHRSSLELCQALVQKYRDHDEDLISKPNKDGKTPLHIAAERNKPKICILLLKNGCEVDAQDQHGNTALHITANEDKLRDDATRICKTLLDYDADWKKVDKLNNTPLHNAARNVNVEICNMLLERGATCMVLQENTNSNCPLECVPRDKIFMLDALRKETDKQRFNELNKPEETPVKHVKLFLCGDQAVGKTTLKKALTKGRWSSWVPRGPNPGHIATPGVNVKAKRIRQVGDFVIWDMAGQIEYHVTHATLLRSSTGVFIVVFDMRWSKEKKKKKLMYWLSFIKAGHKVGDDGFKTPVIVVGTHADIFKPEDKEDERERTQELLDKIIEKFKNFLDIYKELMMINGRKCRSTSMRELKAVVKTVAAPLRTRTTPRLCAKVSEQMAKWTRKNSKLPIMHFKDFFEHVNQEVSELASESLVRLILGYLNDTGELHQVKIRQFRNCEGDNADNFIILNPNWLTTTIFGPIFARERLGDDYSGLDRKQVYTPRDLETYFGKIKSSRILIELLGHFGLAYKRDDASFILPLMLPENVQEIDWQGHEQFQHFFGIRIECKDETDMFTSDTFTCLQVRAMSQYKHSNFEPKLSQRGLMVRKDVEGMIQLTKDMRAIHLAVRAEKGNEELAYQQLCDMKEMALYELNERSIGTQWNLLYLSPLDLKCSKDLEENVYSYTEDALEASMQTTDGGLIHPKGQRRESVAAITGWKDKDILHKIKPLVASDFLTDDATDANVVKTDEESLMELAEKIPDNDKDALGHYLGIKSTKIYQIKNDIDGSRNQTFQILLHWRHKQGANPSGEGLKKALVKLKRNDLAYGVSESAERLNDERLESVVQSLDKRQWQNLAVKLMCSADEVYEKQQTAQVFIKWRRQQPRNVDVIKYFAEGLRCIGRQNAARAVENIATSASTYVPQTRRNSTQAISSSRDQGDDSTDSQEGDIATSASTYVPQTRRNSTQAISSSRDQGDDSTDSQEGDVATSASTYVPQTRPNSTQAISSSRDQGDDSTDSQEGGALTLKDLRWGKTKLGGGAHGDVYPVTLTGRYEGGFKGHINAAAKRVEEGDYATNEIGTLEKLSHPNIVELFCVIGPKEDLNPPFKRMYYIVMERGDMNLFEYMDDRNKPLTTELKFKWALSITNAVKHLHNNRIVHRDLKPQNCIIFTETLKLCDFGISRDASSTMTTKGGRGTFVYLAPETDPYNPTNTGRKKTFSNKSDVYQVGCILWELFARESLPMPPYLELSFLGAHAQIETILRKCLDTNPRNRPDISTLHSHLRSIADATSV